MCPRAHPLTIPPTSVLTHSLGDFTQSQIQADIWWWLPAGSAHFLSLRLQSYIHQWLFNISTQHSLNLLYSQLSLYQLMATPSFWSLKNLGVVLDFSLFSHSPCANHWEPCWLWLALPFRKTNENWNIQTSTSVFFSYQFQCRYHGYIPC